MFNVSFTGLLSNSIVTVDYYIGIWFEVIFMSGVINGGLAHVGGAACGHARCERRNMFGDVFRGHRHLGLCRQIILFSKINALTFYMDLSFLLSY